MNNKKANIAQVPTPVVLVQIDLETKAISLHEMTVDAVSETEVTIGQHQYKRYDKYKMYLLPHEDYSLITTIAAADFFMLSLRMALLKRMAGVSKTSGLKQILSLFGADFDLSKHSFFKDLCSETEPATDRTPAFRKEEPPIILNTDLFDVLVRCGRYFGGVDLYHWRLKKTIPFVNRQTLEEKVGIVDEYNWIRDYYLDFQRKEIRWSEFGALASASTPETWADYGFDSEGDFWDFYSKVYDNKSGTYYFGKFTFEAKTNDNFMPLPADLSPYPFLVFDANLDETVFKVGGYLNFQDGTKKTITRIENISYVADCYIEKEFENQWDDFDDRLLSLGKFVVEPNKGNGNYAVVHFTNMILGTCSLMEVRSNQKEHYPIAIAPAETYDLWSAKSYAVYCLPNGISEVNIKGIYEINGPTQDAKVIDNRILLLENETMFDITEQFLNLLDLSSIEALKEMYADFDFSNRFEIVHFTDFRFIRNGIYVSSTAFERLQGATAYFLPKTEATKWLPAAYEAVQHLEVVFVNTETGDTMAVLINTLCNAVVKGFSLTLASENSVLEHPNPASFFSEKTNCNEDDFWRNYNDGDYYLLDIVKNENDEQIRFFE